MGKGRWGHPNLDKYLEEPSKELVRSVIDKSGASVRRFERFHGMREGALKHFLAGRQTLAAKYWHLFYEILQTKKTISQPKKKTQPAKRLPKPKIDERVKSIMSGL